MAISLAEHDRGAVAPEQHHRVVDQAGQDLFEVQLAADVLGHSTQCIKSVHLLDRLVEKAGAFDKAGQLAGCHGQQLDIVPAHRCRAIADREQHAPGPGAAFDRDRDLRLQVMAGVAARHDPVEVRAESEERDIAEIEQAGEPDDDVQSERKERVNDGDQPVAEEVALVRDEREDRERPEQEYQPSRWWDSLPAPADEAGEAPLGLATLVDVRDPFVHADARLVDNTRSRRHAAPEAWADHSPQTFWITGEPRRPLGRTRNIAIRSANT